MKFRGDLIITKLNTLQKLVKKLIFFANKKLNFFINKKIKKGNY